MLQCLAFVTYLSAFPSLLHVHLARISLPASFVRLCMDQCFPRPQIHYQAPIVLYASWSTKTPSRYDGATTSSGVQCSALQPQVLITNWLTTYGEVIVRVPPRAFSWREAGAVGGNVTYVVCAAYLRTACPMTEHGRLCTEGCQLAARQHCLAAASEPAL